MEATTRKLIRDYGGTVLGAVTVALLIRFFVIEAYRIPTPAMRPTLEPGDTVFVSKAPLGTKLFASDEIKRGDVVLFRPKQGDGRDYIKRVIGLPGDTIKIQNGKLHLNGKPVASKMIANSNCGTETLEGGAIHALCFEPPVAEDYGPEKVPEGSFFALGDFRSGPQMDPENKSVGWGMIPQDSIRGRAMWIWLSIEPPVPSEAGGSSGGFPKLRFKRMFRRIQ